MLLYYNQFNVDDVVLGEGRYSSPRSTDYTIRHRADRTQLELQLPLCEIRDFDMELFMLNINPTLLEWMESFCSSVRRLAGHNNVEWLDISDHNGSWTNIFSSSLDYFNVDTYNALGQRIDPRSLRPGMMCSPVLTNFETKDMFLEQSDDDDEFHLIQKRIMRCSIARIMVDLPDAPVINAFDTKHDKALDDMVTVAQAVAQAAAQGVPTLQQLCTQRVHDYLFAEQTMPTPEP